MLTENILLHDLESKDDIQKSECFIGLAQPLFATIEDDIDNGIDLI